MRGSTIPRAVFVAALMTFSGLMAQPIYEYRGTGPLDLLGYRVAWIGDIDHDGCDDFIMGAPRYNNWTGRTFVHSGSDGSLIYTYTGRPASQNNSSIGSQHGLSLSGAGDVDGDGTPDFLIGARNRDHGRGLAQVYSGATGEVLRSFLGPAYSAAWGDAVAPGGNVDGDAYADFIVGGYHADVNWDDRGGVRVFSGVSGPQLYHFIGEHPGDELGKSVDGGFDVNGDGRDDILVAIWESSAVANDGGAVRVYSGSDGSVLLHADGDQALAKLGREVKWLDDVTGDGIPDFMAAAPWYDPTPALVNAGRLIVYSGLDASVVRVIDGDAAHDNLGFGISVAPDLDGDGFPEIVIGIRGNDDGGPDVGAVRIHSGGSGAVLATYLGPPDAIHFGFSVAAGGDANGDGRTDLLVGEPNFDLPDGTDAAGRVFVLDLGPVGNQPPVAHAGPDQMTHPGAFVFLDASGSTDPDGDYPLAYAWSWVHRPAGSTAELTDPTAMEPAFVPDVLGDYVLELVVTDARGLASDPDAVLISTYNTPPIADAGEDQAVILIGTVVILDASESYDDDGDSFTRAWTFVTRPPGSAAMLSDPTAVHPTFVADVNGAYTLQLVTTDVFGAVSDPAFVTVSFTNLPPVADPGAHPSVVASQTVSLDGSGSHDPNLDTLTYAWCFVSVPTGSTAALSDAAVVDPWFVADLPGTYVVQLQVSDGLVWSDPANLTIEAISQTQAAILALMDAQQTITGIPESSLKNRNMRRVLIKKIGVVLKLIDAGLYPLAWEKLHDDVMAKTDGCATTGAPDPNDWIRTCADQALVWPDLVAAEMWLTGM